MRKDAYTGGVSRHHRSWLDSVEGAVSDPPHGAFALGRPVIQRRGAGAPGSAALSAGSGGGHVHDRVESILRAGGIVAVGLGQVAEAALAAHDGDGRVGQAGEIVGQVAHVRPAAVFIVGEVAHVVQTVFDVPVVPDQRQELLPCDKLGVSFWDYLGSRLDIPGAPPILPLPDLIRQRAAA